MGEAAEIDLEQWRQDFHALEERDWKRVQRIQHEEIEWYDPPDIPDARVHRGAVEVFDGELDESSPDL